MEGLDILEFMAASEEAMENLGKIANWFQPTCTIIIKHILSAIGRLFYRIERVDRPTFDNFMERCIKEPFEVLRNPSDNLSRKHFLQTFVLCFCGKA